MIMLSQEFGPMKEIAALRLLRSSAGGLWEIL